MCTVRGGFFFSFERAERFERAGDARLGDREGYELKLMKINGDLESKVYTIYHCDAKTFQITF